MGLLELVRDLCGAFSSYKKKYEDEKSAHDALKAEVDEAIQLIKEALESE